MTVAPAVDFTVDHDDRLTTVGRTWEAVARAHGAPALRASEVLGRVLWEFFGDLGSIELYRVLFAQVRRSRAISVTFPFDNAQQCCDMRLTIAPLSHAHLACSTSVAVVHSAGYCRPSAPPVRFVSCCSWCGQLKLGDAWLEPSVALATTPVLMQIRAPEVSHGICPTCKLRAFGDLR